MSTTRGMAFASRSPLMGARQRQYATWLLVCVLVAVLPTVVTGGYHQALLTTVGLLAIFGVGLQIIVGTGGILNVAHAAFIAIGAYSSAITTTRGGSAWLGILIGIVCSAILASVVGLPVLRLRSMYLAIGTLCFSLVVSNILTQWSSVTGGHLGLYPVQPFALGDHVMSTPTAQLYLVWAMVMLTILVKINLRYSAVGREFEAIKGSPTAAAALGVSAEVRRLQVFAVGSVIAAVGGSLYATYLTAVTPELFGFGLTMRVFALVAIGGMHSLWGAPVGAAVMVVMQEYLIPRLAGGNPGPYELIVYGSLLIVVMIFAPSGLLDEIGSRVRRVRSRSRRVVAGDDSVTA